MDKLSSFGYVTKRDKGFTDKTTYNDITYVYRENDPSIIFSRRKQSITGIESSFIKYGLIMPYSKKEIGISYDLGTRLQSDDVSLILFMDHINEMDLGEIPNYVSKLDNSSAKVKSIGSRRL